MTELDKSKTASFRSIYNHGFARVAAAVPFTRPADPPFNAQRTIALARAASEQHTALVIFPELGISAYAIDDLLHQHALAQAVTEAIATIVSDSAAVRPLIVVGAPLWAER